MKPWFALPCLALAVLEARAGDAWSFDDRIAVTGPPRAGVYHHLEGAGRRHLALSSAGVAATWEDNREREPQVYVARKPRGQSGFSAARRVSDGGAAFEPAIAALPRDRFLIAWEQDAAVYARVMAGDRLGPALRLGGPQAGQVSLAAHADRVYAAWRERVHRRWFLRVAALRLAPQDRIEVESMTAVEPDGSGSELLFPSLAAGGAGVCVAWEDRRAGHTRLLVSRTRHRTLAFEPPRHLNEFFSGRNIYDQGSGVTRVSLAAFGADEVLAAWMDKRRGGLGYGIFAALGADGGGIFGPNEKVHGAEGDRQPHYNPASAGNARGDFVVAWDDFRRGDADIWLSAYNDDEEWGQDFSPPPASGRGEQSHPAVALDDDGDLHLLWMERADPDAPGRLWYSRGRRAGVQ